MYDCVFVVATTLDETRRAMNIGGALARAVHADFAVIVPAPAPLTVSSARADAQGVDVEDADHPDGGMTVSAVHALADEYAPRPQIVVARGLSAHDLASVVPPAATVVICGPMRRFFETPEQRLARELSNQTFDVVFLPSRDRPPVGTDRVAETEMMRRLIC